MPVAVPGIISTSPSVHADDDGFVYQGTLTPSSSVVSDTPSFYSSDAPSLMVPVSRPSESDSPSFVLSDTPSLLSHQNSSDQPSLLPSNSPTAVLNLAPASYLSDVPSQDTTVTMPPSVTPHATPRNRSMPPLSGSNNNDDYAQQGTEQPSTVVLSNAPFFVPSDAPSMFPTLVQSAAPSTIPSDHPSLLPSHVPSGSPSYLPSDYPSVATGSPSYLPSDYPSVASSFSPTYYPSNKPSNEAMVKSSEPSATRSAASSNQSTPPSSSASDDTVVTTSTQKPSGMILSDVPSMTIHLEPSVAMSAAPSDQPSSLPGYIASDQPTILRLSSRVPFDHSFSPIEVSLPTLPTSAPSVFTTTLPRKTTLYPSLLSMDDYVSQQGSKLPYSDELSNAPTLDSFEARSLSPELLVSKSFIPSDRPTLWLSQISPGPSSGINMSLTATSMPSILSSAEPTNFISNSPSLLSNNYSSVSQLPAQNCAMSSNERMVAIALRLLEISEEIEFNDFESPQYKAFEWLVYDDTCYLCPDDVSVLQQYILAVFYFSTSGKMWLSCSDSCDGVTFLSPTNECDWIGITCDDQNMITSISLASKNISGPLPNELGFLSFLEELNLDSNNLTGSIPTTVGQLSFIKYITIDTNGLSGSIPLELYNASSLMALDLNSNKLVGGIATNIGHLTELYFLQLDFNLMTGNIPTQLSNLPHLQYLSLMLNQFTPTLPTNLCGKGIDLYADCDLCTVEDCPVLFRRWCGVTCLRSWQSWTLFNQPRILEYIAAAGIPTTTNTAINLSFSGF